MWSYVIMGHVLKSTLWLGCKMYVCMEKKPLWPVTIFRKTTYECCYNQSSVLLSARTAMCGFDRVGKWSEFAESRESIRINENHENHYKYSDFQASVWFGLDHWGGKTLFLCDFHWLANQSEFFWGQFLVICEPLWIFGGNSQWFTNHSEIFFVVILGDLWITLNFWGAILSDSWCFVNHSEFFLEWFLMICKQLWVFGGADSQWFFMIVDVSQTTLNFLGTILGDLWTTMKFFGAILGDSQTTLNFFCGDS